MDFRGGIMISLFSVKKEDLGSGVYGREYAMLQFSVEQNKLKPAVAEVVLLEKIATEDLLGYFAIKKEDIDPIFVGKCVFPINSSEKIYNLEAVPPNLEVRLQELRGPSKFEGQFLANHPVYIRAKDLNVRSALESVTWIEGLLDGLERLVSKKNIYNFSLEEMIFPNFQFNFIFNSVKFGQKRISATEEVFGADGICCNNPNELINSWCKYTESSSIHDGTNFEVDKVVLSREGEFYTKKAVVKGNLDFNVLYENRVKEIVELNIRTSNLEEVVVYNVPIDVGDYFIDSAKWQEGVTYKPEDVVVFVEGDEAIFAVCEAGHVSSNDNRGSTDFWRLAQKRDFYEQKHFFFFSKMGKEILENISQHLNLHLLLNYPKKSMEFEARFEDWAGIEVGDKVNIAIDEEIIPCLVVKYKKFYSYERAYVKVKCISLDTSSDESAVQKWKDNYGSDEFTFGRIKLFETVEIVGSPDPVIFPSIDVQKKESGEIKIKVPDGGIWIQEKLLRLRGYLDGGM